MTRPLRIRARPALRAVLALLALLALGSARATPLAAQEAATFERRIPGWVKYGKWGLLVGSVTMNLLAARAHESADAEFDQLRERCLSDGTLCAMAIDGTYVDPESERLYQRSVAYDRRARLWLVAGQTALIGSAVMFVWEFTRPKGPPGNIPFEPEVSATPTGTNVGLRVAF